MVDHLEQRTEIAPHDKVVVWSTWALDGEFTRDILKRAGIACTVIRNLASLEAAIQDRVSTAIFAAEILTSDNITGLKMIFARRRPWLELAVIIMAGAESPQLSSKLMREIYDSFHQVTFLMRPVAIDVFVGIVKGTVMEHQRRYDVRALLESNERELSWRRALEASLRQANEQISASEARYRRLLDTANEGILILNINGRIDYANRRIAEMLGYAPVELRGWFFKDIVKISKHGDEPLAWLHALPYQSGQEECEFCRKDGSHLVGIVSHNPIDSNSSESSDILVMITDITYRREMEERFRQLTENIRQVFWLKRPEDGSIIYVSPALEAVWGKKISKSNTVTPEYLLESVHAEDQGKVLKFWQEQALGEERATEYRIIRSDETFHWISERSFPIKNAEGRVYRIAGIAEDITEIKKSHAELEAARQAAEAANRAKSAFLANLSHEIRTPICAMVGFTELLEDVNLPAEDRRSYCNIIARNGAQLVTLIDDILDLSKIEAGFLQIDRTKTSLPHLLTDVKNALAIRARNKSIALTIDINRNMPELIYTDPTRLRQILLNIIGNAIKFTNKGSVKVTASYRWRGLKEPGELRFVIDDTGCGISEEGKSKLFAPFSQADTTSTRKFGGTGLGLALSKRLALSLGGDVILAWSEPGQGSRFIVTIKAQPAAAEHSQITESESESLLAKTGSKQQEQPLTGLHILLAEDAVDSQLLISKFLKIAGAKVDVVNDGAEAVTKAMGDGYDVVLMDVQMPVLDGYGATGVLRNRGYIGPIIALTAHAMLGEKEKSLEAGCDYHLVKPIDRLNLVNTVALFSGRKLS